MAMESAGIPFPSEVIMPFGGFVASATARKLTLLGIVITGALGTLFGSIVALRYGAQGRTAFSGTVWPMLILEQEEARCC